MKQDINESRDDLAGDLGLRFKEAVRANQTATDMFDEALSQFLGINRTDGRCMDIIDRLGRITAGQLATESGLTTGAVTAVVDRLETAGYLRRVRDPADRRKVWIEATEEFRTITARIFGHYARTSPKLMQRFTREQLRGIYEFLEIGSLLNRDLAAVLKDLTDPAADTIAARLIQARAFERAAEAYAPRLEAALDDIERSTRDLE